MGDIKRDETMAPPSIILQNETESKMAGATEIIRATSPRLDQNRPQFKRQNSKEMQQAVEVQRPLSFERQKTLSVSLTTDNLSEAWMDDNVGSIDDDELDKELDEKKKKTSWSSITAKVVPKSEQTKCEKNTKKISKHETLIVQAENYEKSEVAMNVDEEGFEQCVGRKEKRPKRKSQKDIEVIKVEQNTESQIFITEEVENNVPKTKLQQNVEQRKSYAGLPIDTVTDAWMNDDLGSLESDEEEEDKPLALTGPSWAGIASKVGVSGYSDPELPLPPEVVSLKSTKSETIIVEAEGEERQPEDMEVDPDGFEIAVSRKIKRERRISKRLSVSMDEALNEVNDVIDRDIVQYDMKAIEDAENKYFESIEIKNKIKKTECQEFEKNESKPLALPAPTWAGIASKPTPLNSADPELPSPPDVISAKPSKAELLIVEAEGEEKSQEEVEVDEEGFELSETRKRKKERRISKRISVAMDDETENYKDIIDKDHNMYDMKAIEDAEIKYFESVEQSKSKVYSAIQESGSTETTKKEQRCSESKPLGLPAPTWAGIASKPILSGS